MVQGLGMMGRRDSIFFSLSFIATSTAPEKEIRGGPAGTRGSLDIWGETPAGGD